MSSDDIGLASYSGGRTRRSAKSVLIKIQEKKRLQAALLAIQVDIDASTKALSTGERRKLDELLMNKCSRAGCERPAMIKGRCNKHYLADWFESQGECSVAGCRRRAHTAKMCQPHYAQLVKPKTPCSIDGCETPVFAKGMCQRHYRRTHVHGDPHIVLTDHLFKKMDHVDR